MKVRCMTALGLTVFGLAQPLSAIPPRESPDRALARADDAVRKTVLTTPVPGGELRLEQTFDDVFSQDQGDCNRGKPGELTGRNTARQQIPVALAKLGAVQAMEPLRRILGEHHDWYLRDNAAYALARLEPAADHAKLVAEMQVGKVVDAQGRMDFAKDRYRHLYAFGRGLLQRGDDGGIEFMAFKYSTYDAFVGLSETVYMLEQRINDLKETRSPKLEGFCKQAFAHERVMALFMWNQTKFKADDYDLSKAALRIEELFDSLCQMIESNRLAALRPTMQRVAKDSSHEVIRRRAERCAGQLGEPI